MAEIFILGLIGVLLQSAVLAFLKTAVTYCHVLPVRFGGFTTVGGLGAIGVIGGF